MSDLTTGIICILITLAIVAWDIVLASDGKTGNTISEVSRKAGRFWPPIRLLVPFAMGLITGHVWWT